MLAPTGAVDSERERNNDYCQYYRSGYGKNEYLKP